MNRDEIKARVIQLNEERDRLGFPHEDCRKIGDSIEACDWIKADVNTFFHSLWSLSAIDKLVKLPDQELERYNKWLEKSFFERFPKYVEAEKVITPKFTPKLFKALEINEELRRLILIIVSAELQLRNPN